MHIYLRPQNDGLPMLTLGRWTEVKLDYVARYIDVFETSMRDKWTIRNYVDLFAGPGKVWDPKSGTILPGSPLIALTAKHPFTGYFFTELDGRNKNALEKRCAKSPYHNRVWIRAGDCNQLVDSIVAKIRQHDESSLNLAFLDPSKVKALKWETVEKLATLRRMDLVVHYPQGGLNRCMRHASETITPTVVDRYFGGREWREIYQTYRQSGVLHRHLIDLYKEKLKALDYQIHTGDEPLIRNLARGAPMYRLLFASKHALGQEFWTKILQRDVYGQRRLFEEPLDYG